MKDAIQLCHLWMKITRIWRFQKKNSFFFQISIKTSSHTYFGPIFFSHERKLSLVSRDIFIFFQILLESPQNLVRSWKKKIVKNMEISDKNDFFQNSIKTASHTYFGPIFFFTWKKIAFSFTGYFYFFSNPIGSASKLSLKLKKLNCQEYGDFRKKRFFFKIRLKPLPIHILGQFFYM